MPFFASHEHGTSIFFTFGSLSAIIHLTNNSFLGFFVIHLPRCSNHFQQSYTLQVQRILQPIFARLGVYHEARNLGQGGLGTLQNAMALQSLYGGDLDMLLWDSGEIMSHLLKK